MNVVRRLFFGLGIFLVVAYLAICILLYFQQERMIFHPHPLPGDFSFAYKSDYREIKIPTYDGKKLSGLLFKADSTKGLIFYLHGNAGALDTWGDIADIYTNLGYDIFILDYRGFGKSEGKIIDEEQFFKDAQTAYDTLKTFYDEGKIVVEGYSIGTGAAAMLAATNKPRLLILQAPYYSLTDLGEHLYPAITPRFLNRYKFETYKYVEQTKAPVVIFHGDADETIYYGSALKLKEHFKAGDTLVTLPGAPHGRLNQNPVYQDYLKELLK